VSEAPTETEVSILGTDEQEALDADQPAEPEGPPPRGKWNPPDSVHEIPLKYQKNKKYF
jgi:hypothetical protein